MLTLEELQLAETEMAEDVVEPKRLEVCRDRSYLQQFGGADFSGIAEEDRSLAADVFQLALLEAIDDSGDDADLTWSPSSGERATAEGFHAEPGFRHRIGPFATFDDLSDEQIAMVRAAIKTAETKIRREFA